MNYRKLGKTGFNVSEISLGTWQLGGKWGEEFNFENAEKILNLAIEKGINFIDTADIYNNGKSEEAIGKFLRKHKEKIYVATKCGKFLNPHTNATYQPAALRKFVEDSLKNMGVDCLDLIQLHCPPPEVYDRSDIFELFDRLKEEGKILNLGVSIEKIDEGLKAIRYSNVTTIQIIFNMFRHRPAEHFFKEAKKKDVGIIVRVPLASGLLTGKYNLNTVFSSGDHRNFNREGKAFDKGETFSGIDYEQGLKAVEELKNIFGSHVNLAHVALKWILSFEEVSCIIPGISAPYQIDENLNALTLPEITSDQMNQIKRIYDEYIKPSVHDKW